MARTSIIQIADLLQQSPNVENGLTRRVSINFDTGWRGSKGIRGQGQLAVGRKGRVRAGRED